MGFGGEAAVHLRQGARALTRAGGLEEVAHGDGEIAQAGEHLRGATMQDWAAVLVVGAVAPVVQGVLDAPVLAHRFAQRECVERFDTGLASKKWTPDSGGLGVLS